MLIRYRTIETEQTHWKVRPNIRNLWSPQSKLLGAHQLINCPGEPVLIQ
jgi:hypothetical protein